MPVTLDLCNTQSTAFDAQEVNPTIQDLFVTSALAKYRSEKAYDEPDNYSEPLVKSELSSSLDSGDDRIFARDNGLVHALEAAYSRHYHLVLRPDDVWITLLTQFSIYVNKNAENMRGTFVSHEGQKT